LLLALASLAPQVATSRQLKEKEPSDEARAID
jgi:hypothetical protein